MCSEYGNYFFQRLVTKLSLEQRLDVLRLLGRNLVFLFTNENGHHVIQKIIIDYPEERRPYINQCIFDNIDKICVNEYWSLCVIKFINFNMNLLLRVELITATNTKVPSLLESRV